MLTAILIFGVLGAAGVRHEGSAIGQGPHSPDPRVNQTARNGVADNQPVGNGEVVGDVWAENGTIGLLLGRSDVFSSSTAPLKLGRVFLSFDPDPFDGQNATYTQALELATATVRALVVSGSGVRVEVTVWSDINSVGQADSIHIAVNASHPVHVSARVDVWRTQLMNTTWQTRGPCGYVLMWPDTVIPSATSGLPEGQVGWYHRNPASQYTITLQQQMLGAFANRTADPLLNRTSGALLSGTTHFTTVNDTSIRSTAPATEHALTIVTQTATTTTAEDWLQMLRQRAAAVVPASEARDAHEAWWSSFWQRSWVTITASGAKGVGADVAFALSQAYDLTRYLTAIQSRGQLPIHHNGGTVCWGWDGKSHADPDLRPWGGGYWFQNTRHMYWYALGAGDLDLLDPLFGMYSRQLPLLRERTQLWYNHSGTTFGETSYFFGAYEPVDYGCTRFDVPEAASPYIRHYFQGGAELSVIMLQAYSYSSNASGATMLLQSTVLPWVSSMLTFYDQHYPKYENGTLWLKDAQALETWPNCTNPTPQVAALYRICEGMLAINTTLVPPETQTLVQRVCVAGGLPRIPLTQTGLLSPCEGGFPTTGHVNSENVETYAIWPYELYAVNRSTEARWPLAVAQASFAAVHFGHGNTAWRYDGQDAAIMGMASYALSMITARVMEQGTCDNASFPGYLAKDASDGAPQLESNGIVSVTLQKMLLQIDGRRLLLFPAWLKGLDVDAKLHFPSGPDGALSGSLRVVLKDGVITMLDVTPTSRRDDVVILPLQDGPPPPPPPPPTPNPCVPPPSGERFVKHPGLIGSQFLNGAFPCTNASVCPAEAQAYCEQHSDCRSFAIDPAWNGGRVAEVYVAGLEGASKNVAWTLWVRTCVAPSSPEPQRRSVTSR